ncbi:NAD/NADP transhydrogenase alpha subunit [Paenibacillus sp. IB182496]|uniref:NAD/NADP transhydrogenase alpha subunit n=1 Tax=Paenibacillus sabuli TaxID=2772509 RepID=A0A927GRV9_9BACL|nr:NAD/NADP transhydrogenase alpha subunit [Paenibacillus sabuli]MBD2845087.1 NAD/NADP transhydrogenase alpha subunit [Paenibacillus sabuli]
MKCISVYTNNFELFSDLYPQILASPPEENEDIVLEGITVSGSGEVPEQYLERMRLKPEVVVMKERKLGITILQHGSVFEICMPYADGELEKQA